MIFQALPRLDTYSTSYLKFAHCNKYGMAYLMLGRSCCGKENSSKPYKLSWCSTIGQYLSVYEKMNLLTLKTY